MFIALDKCRLQKELIIPSALIGSTRYFFSYGLTPGVKVYLKPLLKNHETFKDPKYWDCKLLQRINFPELMVYSKSIGCELSSSGEYGEGCKEETESVFRQIAREMNSYGLEYEMIRKVLKERHKEFLLDRKHFKIVEATAGKKNSGEEIFESL